MQQFHSKSKKVQIKHESNQDFKLPSLSKSPAPASKKNSSTKSEIRVPQSSKNDFEIELKSKHRILKSMVNVEKQNLSAQDSSSLNYSFKRMSAGMKLLGKHKNSKNILADIYENMTPANEYSYKINDTDKVAKKKYLVSDHNTWAVKHKMVQIRRESAFNEFLEEFFQCIDSSHTDQFPLNDIILPLMTYGVASDSATLERSLRVIFKVDDLWASKINKKEFIEHLKEDKLTGQIIKVMHESALELFGNLDELFPRLYFSIENYMKTVGFWWKSLCKFRKIVHNSKIAHFLSSKNLIQGFSKAVKFCASFIEEEFFDLQSFERIFLKPIFLAQLKNISYGISLEKSELPMSLKLALYQRKLLITGVSGEKQGKVRATLQGAYKFNRKNSSINDMSAADLKKKLEIEENSNKLRIKQAIYEAEHEGCEFISKDGEIREDIVNIWDVKNNMSSKEASPNAVQASNINPSPMPNTSNRDISPYTRNVKIFRDNFLFEKFQKVTSSTLDLLGS